MVILAAIIALGASGVVLIMLAIAHTPTDDETDATARAGPVATNVNVTVRRDGVMPALHNRRPVTEAGGAAGRAQKPHRRSAVRESWRRLRRDVGDFAYRRRRAVDGSNAKLVAGITATSAALGLLIVHLSP